MLPEVDRTKIEITNPQFRIVEKTDSYTGIKLFYPQRKFLGLFWIGMVTQYGSYVRYEAKKKYCLSKEDALSFIENFRPKKKKQSTVIHYV